MDAPHALYLSFCSKPLVETFVPEFAHAFRPWRQSLAPTSDSILFAFVRFSRGEIRTDTHHGFESYRFSDHVIRVTPGFAPHFGRRLEIVPSHSVITCRRAFIRAFLLNL